MKRSAIACLVFALGAVAVPAFATPSNTIALGPGTGTTVVQGQSFNMTISITAGEPFDGVTIFLLSSASNSMDVTGRSNVWSGPNSLADPNAGSITGFLPTAGNSADFGYTGSGGGGGVGPPNIPAGTYNVETLTIATPANLTPGPYTITTGVGSELTDAAFDEFPLPQTTYQVTVTAAPEPASLSLLMLSFGGLLVRRRSVAC
jgi:hypothetical protein